MLFVVYFTGWNSRCCLKIISNQNYVMGISVIIILFGRNKISFVVIDLEYLRGDSL